MADTITVLSINTHSSGTQTLQSDKVKGDAYFGQNDGLHTVMVDLNDFIGTIKIQGSLETTPTATDWFDAELSDGEYTIDTTGKVTEIIVNNLTYAVAETSIKAYNTTGNFVWLRADVSNWTCLLYTSPSPRDS